MKKAPKIYQSSILNDFFNQSILDDLTHDKIVVETLKRKRRIDLICSQIKTVLSK